MPNISSLTMPDGIVYNIKDSQARKDIEDIKKNGFAESGGSSGGGGLFVVNGTFNEGSQTAGTVDKTDAEIFEAANSGKMVQLSLSVDGITLVRAITGFTYFAVDGSTFYTFEFSGINANMIETYIVGSGSFERDTYPLGQS